ncbi:MAG: polyphenol oxidase family protein [Gaiellaceae bacterium]
MIRWQPTGPYDVLFSTRVGGVSEGPYDSLNLGRMTGDAPENVIENRRRLCAALDADPDRATMTWQVHGTDVVRAEPLGIVTAGTRHPQADGLWTAEPGLALLQLTADCVPIALVRLDGETPAVAVLHAGWRGLAGGVVARGVEALGSGRLAACVGPAIGPCCYEVGDEVAGHFDPALMRGRNLDLWVASEQALVAAGVEEVERVDLCTACHSELFFSHWRDAGVTGRQGVIARVA